MLHHAAAFCEMNDLNIILALTTLKHINWHDKFCFRNALCCLLWYLTWGWGLDLSCKHRETSSDYLLAKVVIS